MENEGKIIQDPNQLIKKGSRETLKKMKSSGIYLAHKRKNKKINIFTKVRSTILKRIFSYYYFKCKAMTIQYIKTDKLLNVG